MSVQGGCSLEITRTDRVSVSGDDGTDAAREQREDVRPVGRVPMPARHSAALGLIVVGAVLQAVRAGALRPGTILRADHRFNRNENDNV